MCTSQKGRDKVGGQRSHTGRQGRDFVTGLKNLQYFITQREAYRSTADPAEEGEKLGVHRVPEEEHGEGRPGCYPHRQLLTNLSAPKARRQMPRHHQPL